MKSRQLVAERSSNVTICGTKYLNYKQSKIKTVQRLMLSKGAKRTIFYHITVILQYCLEKTIARSEDMYRDDLGILNLVIKCFSITNTSVQYFAIRTSSVNTVPKWLRKFFFEQIVYRCITFIDVFAPCDNHLLKIFRKSCDIVSNPFFFTFT